MSEFLIACNLVKDYPQGDTPLRVIKGISLNVPEGDFLVIAGGSGAGKSTLLHLLGILDTPTSGELHFEGRSLTTLSNWEQSRLRNQLFGFVFQFFHLLPDFSALENVVMPVLVGSSILTWRHHRRAAFARAAQLLSQLGLGERLGHRPAHLSGGERQRVAICRALINRPRVLLLDEPTGNLDSQTGARIHALIADLNEKGQTIIMVTHDEGAAKRAKRVIRIKDGQIIS